MCDLCEPADIHRLVVPQCLAFCRDPVSAVRVTAIAGGCHLLSKLKALDEAMFADFAEEIKKLAVQPSFSGRQL